MMIHHQAITRPDIGSVDSLMIIIALIPIKTETHEVTHAAGQIVNTNPIESILLSLICRSSWGVIVLSLPDLILGPIQKLSGARLTLRFRDYANH